MKKFKRIVSFVLAFLMVFTATLTTDFGNVSVSAASSTVTFTKQGGWFETAYAEWDKVTGATEYRAYVKKVGGSYTQLDDELLRQYSDHWRVDAVGLAAGEYQIKVEAKVGSTFISNETGTLTVKPYDRSGFAWVDGTASGAYNEDGTLKSDAVVLYITEETKDTVSMDVVTSSKGATTNAVGLQNILNLYKKTYETRPLDIRIIGKVTDLAVLEGGDLVLSGSGATSRVSCGITIEGIGEDATIYGFGIRIKNCSNIEVRNIAVMAVDSSEGDCVSLQQDNDHIWVHNIDFFYGMAGGDSDQAKGDGSLDCKSSTYVTFSYNHFWDSGKCNLLGLKEGTTEGLYITYHHNWYDHSDSRHPRARFYTVHTYNNYFDGNAKYGIGSASNSNIFAESNYFRNCQYPIMTSLQASDIYAGGTVADTANGTFSGEYGGVVKAYGNIMVGNYTFVPYGCSTYVKKGVETAFDLEGADSTKDFDAYVVANKSDTVPSEVKNNTGVVTTGDNGTQGLSYNNFDTSSTMYSYTADDAADVPDIVTTYAGRMNGGDFEYDFSSKTYTQNNATVNADKYYGVDTELKSLVVNYESSIVSIGGGDTSDPSELKGIVVSPSSKTLLAGGTVQLTVAPSTSQATLDGKTVTYESSNTSVATVSSTGLVTAVAVGTATITATVDSFTAECAITVSAPVALAGIKINETDPTVQATKTITLTASATNDTTDEFTVTWSSANTGVATVNASTGVVTGVAEGTAVITATATTTGGTTKTAEVTVTVTAAPAVPAGGYIHNFTTDGLTSDDFYTITGDEKSGPTQVTYGTLTLTRALKMNSSGTVTFAATQPGTLILVINSGTKINVGSSVVNVDSSGVTTVNIESAGTYTISKNSGESCLYYVQFIPTGSSTPDPVAVTSVSVSPTTVTLTEGETKQLTATVLPEDADDKSVTWSSDKTSVATVSTSGLITAVAEGTATITVTTTDGAKTATCAVTVNKAASTPVAVTSVSVSPTTVTLTEGETEQLTATVLPEDADDKSVTWSSDKTSVATVSTTGLITAVAEGTATITVTTTDGAKTATCAVTVNKASTDPIVKHTVYLVGDSTVCSFDDDYYYPRYGYGTQIGNYIDSTYFDVNNLALSGRSSLSYLSESNYTTLKNSISSGDILIIGFGHNDEKEEPARYTNPNGDYTTEGSFAYTLYENYVKVAKAAGAEVILCTPICRRNATDTLTDDNKHITTTTVVDGVTYEGGDYAAAIKKLGTDVDVPVVDLTGLTATLYETIGASETLYMHAWSSNKEASVDNTHLNIYGAKKIAYMLANAIKTNSVTSLAPHIVLGTEPTKENDLVSNPNYVEKPYSSDLPDSTIWQDYKNVFKGTVFGDVGGASKISTTYYTVETDSNGAMHIAAANNGKIASTSDGIAMYYYKVPASSSFTLTAKATINTLNTSSNQSAFGLMARDDMYIDTYDTAIASDYVVAGTIGGTAPINCFNRKSGTLNKGAALSKETLSEGSSYDLSIVSNADGYACTFGTETTQTGGYDFKLVTIDSDYVYVGMFATKNMDITYSDIVLTVDGVVILDTSTPVTYTAELVKTGLSGADAALSKTSDIAASDTVTLTITPDSGYAFATAPEVSVTGATKGAVTANSDGSYTCTITSFTANATVTVTGSTVSTAEPTYEVTLVQTGLSGATAALDKPANVYASTEVVVTITPGNRKQFTTAPTVTATGATAGTPVKQADGSYKATVTTFTANATITVAGTATDEPSYAFSINKTGLSGATVSSDTNESSKVYNDETVTITITPDSGLSFKTAPVVTATNATAGDVTLLATGAYKCEITNFSGTSVITVTGEAVNPADDPTSLDAKLDCTYTVAIADAAAGADLGNGFTAMSAITVVTAGDKAKAFVGSDGTSYVYSKAESTSNCIAAGANGDMIKFVAPQDGTVKIAFKVSSSNKTGTIFGETITSTTSSVYAYREISVTKGQTYTAGVSGSKLRIFYLGYTPSGDIPTTYTATLVKTGLVGADAVLSKTTDIASTDSVTVTITPTSGYTFATAPTVTVDGATAGSVVLQSDGSYKCNITGFTKNATVTVAGEAKAPVKTYTVSVVTDGNGTASASKTTVNANEAVTLTATPATGYKFKEWTIVSGTGAVLADKTAATTTLTVASADVTVKATFERKVLDSAKVKAFVTRLYTVVLNRQPDENGIADWTTRLLEGTQNGASVSYGFVFSDEFEARNLSNSEKVDIMYATFLDRAADAPGKKMWVDALDAGVGVEKIYEGFVMSDEFASICDDYGISAGTMSDAPGMVDRLNLYRNRNIFVTEFVARCYTKALGRVRDIDGVELWCRLIITGEWTPRNVAANGFINSDEFLAKNTTNKEYVEILYRTFFDREADTDGLNTWLNLLDGGMYTRDMVLDGFADSDEFKEVLASFGLN